MTSAAPATQATPLLELEGVNTYYGQIHILQDSNMVIGEGELVCLLGGNASGKSTTLKTILGLVRPRTGTVRLAGEDVTRMATAHRIKRGLAIVPENRRLFGPMTVLQNLEMGAYLRPRADLKEEFERVYSLFPLLYERRSQLAGTLSGGEQQMVAMGRALMSKPKLLLMDEPSMGLAPVLVERSFEIIRQVNDAGRGDARRRAECERVPLDRRPRLRALDRSRRARGQGRRPARGRRPEEGLPWPLSRRSGERGSERPSAASFRSSRPRPISTRARKVRCRTGFGKRSRRGSRAGTRTGRVGVLGGAERGRAVGVRAAAACECRRGGGDDLGVTGRRARSSSALDFAGERNRIVISEYEFPTIGQIAHAQELRGAEVVHVEPEADG